VTMRGGSGFPMRFALGKYTGVDEWGFYIQGRHGYVYLEPGPDKMLMDVVSPVFKGSSKIDAKPEGAVIMGDFMRRVRDPAMQHEYGFENCKETLELTLRVREECDKRPYFEYETGDLPSMHEIIRMYRRE
jgi:hypothetical protein